MNNLTTTYSEELSSLLYEIEDLGRINISVDHNGKNVTVKFDEAEIRATVDKDARGEFINKYDRAVLRFNALVTKFAPSVAVSEEGQALNAERSTLVRMEAQLAQTRNMRGMTTEALAKYETALEAQRAKVAALEAGE